MQSAHTASRRLAAILTLLLVACAPVGALAKKGKHTTEHALPGSAQQAPAPQPAPAAAAPAPAEPQQQQSAAPLDPKEAELKAAYEDALAVATKGPAKAALLDQADITLAPGQAFIPKTQALRVLRAYGNNPEADGMAGLVIGLNDSDSWLVVMRYVNEGYVKDDDAKNWSADELLTSLKEGTEESNADRVARGFPEVEVVRWIEAPAYDAASHRLVWSILSKQKGTPDAQAQGVNYNTYALGRQGYFSLNLLTSASEVEQQKPVAKGLLANLAYRPGKRYEDFNASTDQIAAYGLAALVGGVAAKKLGLLALGAAFFAKFAKLIVLGVAGLGAAAAKLFGKKSDAA